MAKTANKSDSGKFKSTEDWLEIIAIKGGLIEVKGSGVLDRDNQYVTGIRVEPKNIFIADQTVQNQAINGLSNFYNTIDYEFWLICCDRPVDINLFRSELEIQYQNATSQQERKLISQDISKCEMFTGPQVNAVDTEYFILFKDSVKQTERIQKRISSLISNLASAGLTSRQITEEDVRVILDSFFNDSLRTEFGTVMS